jgi:threonyl-tRNA synthetase
LQVDFILPERLGAHYIDDQGNKQVPVILHRAILGSLERFVGILIEQYEGKFPLWLSPIQVAIATVTTDVDNYAQEVFKQLKANGVRTILDISNDKITYKIRKHSLEKIPLLVIIGREEAENKKLSVRALGSDDKTIYNINEFLEYIKQQTKE